MANVPHPTQISAASHGDVMEVPRGESLVSGTYVANKLDGRGERWIKQAASQTFASAISGQYTLVAPVTVPAGDSVDIPFTLNGVDSTCTIVANAVTPVPAGIDWSIIATGLDSASLRLTTTSTAAPASIAANIDFRITAFKPISNSETIT